MTRIALIVINGVFLQLMTLFLLLQSIGADTAEVAVKEKRGFFSILGQFLEAYPAPLRFPLV